jgi:hypothetical protein
MKGTIVLIAKRGTLSVRLVAYMSRYILTRPAKRVGSVTSESVVAIWRSALAGRPPPACCSQPSCSLLPAAVSTVGSCNA